MTKTVELKPSKRRVVKVKTDVKAGVRLTTTKVLIKSPYIRALYMGPPHG